MTKKGGLAVINNGIEFLIGSLILVLVTKLYSVEESGAWIVFITLLFVGTKLREGVTQTSLMKFSVGVTDQQRFSVYWLSIFLSIGIELILGGLSYFAGSFLMEGALALLLKNYIWIALPQSLFRLFQFISQSRLDVRRMFNSNLFLLLVLIAILTYILKNEIPFHVLPLYIGIAFLFSSIWQFFVHKIHNWRLSFKEWSVPEGYRSFALNGLLREMFGTISSRAYILLTAGYVGLTESALVGIASRYANLIYLPNSAYQGLLYPKACELVNKGHVQAMFGFYRRSVAWMQAAFIPYVVLLLSIGSAGIILLHGNEYISAIPFFSALVLAGAFIAPFGHAFGSVCQAAGRPGLVTKIVLLNSSLNLILSFFLIKNIGVWGGIMAPLITDILGLILISIMLKKVFNNTILESFIRIISRFIALTRIIHRILKQRMVIS